MLVSLTVGKVDAGVTVLLTPDKRLIEFPSILLPPDISSGSIVDITVSRNTGSEVAAERAFRALQEQIYQAFGAAGPSTPVLRCRNATQTSVVLEWDPIELATADLISLSLFRNGQKAGNIPDPRGMHSTKISGLAVDTEYAFHLVLRTTAGTLSSERVTVRTHKMTDLSGITITTGVLPAAAREALNSAVERIGAKMVEGVRIDTTHFVTTEGRGVAWERANEMNIPVVRPEWVEACEKNGRILGVTKFYLDAVRTGLPGDDFASAASTPAPAPGPFGTPAIPPTKELPLSPPARENGRDDVSSLRSQRTGRPEDVSEEEEVDDSEEAAKGKYEAIDEQKGNANERDKQKLAVRSPPTVEDDTESLHTPGWSGDNGGKSPAGRGSFQDVAL